MNDAREHAVELVQQAYAEGRLTTAELDRRLEAALTATSSRDLVPIVADLPQEQPVHLVSTGGHITRTGDWTVPRRLRIDSEYGRVRLDLSHAHIPYHRIDLELNLTYGSARIILPPGATANTDGLRTDWGRTTTTAPTHPHPTHPHLQISGHLPYGHLTIRTRP